MIELANQILRWRQDPASMVRELFNVEPDLWQLEVLNAFPTSPRIAMKAAKGVGKAQPHNTLIETIDGSKRFGDLVVGDQVFSVDGAPTKVIGIYEQGVKKVYRVIFDDGSSTVVCGEHLWTVRGQAERARKHQDPYKRRSGSGEI